MKRQKKESVFRRFLRYIKPYWFLFALAAIGGIIKFTVPLVFPQVIRYFIDVVLADTSSFNNTEKEWIINYWVSVVVGLYICIWIPGTFIRHYFTGSGGNRVIFDLRYEVYQHIQRMSSSYFSDHKSGGIVSILMNDIALAKNMVGNALTNIWMDGTIIIILLFIMFRMNWILTVTSLGIFPFYIYTIKKLGRKVKASSRRVQDETEVITGELQEKIAGFSVIQAFTQEKTEQKHFWKESRKLLHDMIRTAELSCWNNVVIGFLTSVGPILVVWVAAQLILRGDLTVGEMVVFYSYLGMFYLPIQRFSELSVVFSTSLAALERIFEALDLEPDVQEKLDAVECPKNIEGRIEFKDVSFGYKEKLILKNINLTIEPGHNVAIVGGSGSGKSTLTNLIPRFYDVTKGALLIDGGDVRDCKLKPLRQNIGLVLQETILFSGTLRENILYGNPNATEEEIIQAAKDANAYEFIQRMENGLDTEIGERGFSLSGGQKQRIALTRAFIKDPKILILDEATSALDSESENLIQEALERLMKGRTTIMIAHRLSTIMNADMILVMDQGRIIEKGNHEELLEVDGMYRHLFEQQFRDVKALIEKGAY